MYVPLLPLRFREYPYLVVDKVLTLTPQQVSELAEEQELRDLFERFGRVTRVFLARDRETQRAKGFAFISFADRSDAARACEKMDDCTFLLLCTLLKLCKMIDRLTLNSWLSPPHSPRRICQADHLISFFFLFFFLFYSHFPLFLRYDTFSGPEWMAGQKKGRSFFFAFVCMNFDNEEFHVIYRVE